MNITSLTFVLIYLLCQISAASEELLKEWTTFKQKYYPKRQMLKDERHRYEIFRQNYEKIKNHNLKYQRKEVSYEMGINEFSDKSDEELMSKPALDHSGLPSMSATRYTWASKKMKGHFDWRDKGYVTKVKNQGVCESCWAFITTGALEGQYFAQTGHLISFSEQMLMDCVIGINGCATPSSEILAYQWIKNNSGINYEAIYPYEETGNVCRFKKWAALAPVRDLMIAYMNENIIQTLLMNMGPIGTSIYASPNFRRYNTGIFNDTDCKGKVNHGVLLVGYGTENGQDYYIAKNSWGTSWGDNGYVKMLRNINICEVGRLGVIPVL